MTEKFQAPTLPPTITTRYPDGTVLTGACCGQLWPIQGGGYRCNVCGRDWPVVVGPARVAVATELAGGAE